MNHAEKLESSAGYQHIGRTVKVIRWLPTQSEEQAERQEKWDCLVRRVGGRIQPKEAERIERMGGQIEWAHADDCMCEPCTRFCEFCKGICRGGHPS